MLATIEKEHPRAELPPEAERPLYAQWNTYLPPQESAQGLPPLRIILVWDNLAGHLTPSLVVWLFHHGVMPLYTPVGSSWLNMADDPLGSYKEGFFAVSELIEKQFCCHPDHRFL